MMDGNRDEWAVVFHGTSGIYLRSMFNDRAKGTMLHAGQAQRRSDDICIKTNKKVDIGVYVSPYFLTCLLEYTPLY
jgi:hypothetical protein